MTAFALFVSYKSGNPDYLREKLDNAISRFPTRAAAERQREKMTKPGTLWRGVESVTVVAYPKEKERTA